MKDKRWDDDYERLSSCAIPHRMRQQNDAFGKQQQIRIQNIVMD